MRKITELYSLQPDRLKIVRKGLGISKAEAARRLNLSKMGYGRYESGERTPSPQMVQVIAEGLGTSVDYLVGLTNDISPDRIVVYKSKSPKLFELTSECNADNKLLNRLYSYYSSLSNTK